LAKELANPVAYRFIGGASLVPEDATSRARLDEMRDIAKRRLGGRGCACGQQDRQTEQRRPRHLTPPAFGATGAGE
jgi:hypothetical protein